MKYISPQTEKRKQQKKKRRKQQMLICGILFSLIIVVSGVVLVLGIGRDKPSSSVHQENISSSNQESQTETGSSDLEYNENLDDKVSSEEIKNEPDDKKTPKKKKSLGGIIKSLFAKTEPIPVTFPATAFGVTIDSEINEIISLSPLATEVILSSPSQNALVAVSNYCNKRGNDRLMTVGTPLIPDVEKIIQLKADCLIVQTPLSDTDRKKIEENGITVLEISYPETAEDLYEIYRSVTALTHGGDIATFESERIAADVAEKLNLYTLALDGQNKLNAVMLFNTFGMVATPDTMEGKLLGYFFDVKDFGKGYMAESMDAVVAHNPEVIIAAEDITDEQIAEIGLGDTNAVANKRVYRVDIQQFENLSLKSVKTLSGIANEVYGSIIQPPVIETEEK